MEYKPKIRMIADNLIIGMAAIIYILVNPSIVGELAWSLPFGFIINYLYWVPIIAIIWYVHSILYIQTMNYTISQEKITKERGVFGRYRQDLPYERITNIHKDRKLMDRILGLTSIGIQTAGSDAVEMWLYGLSYDDGEKIYNELSKFKKGKGDAT